MPKLLLASLLFSLSVESAYSASTQLTVTGDPLPPGTYTITVTPPPPDNGSTPFTALHTYFMSPTGKDTNNGASAATPWLTANHPVVCGDVIVAAAGAYNSANLDSYGSGSPRWGTVSSCPSTTGGIDGKGGVYVATVLCATPFDCTIDASTKDSVNIDKSNWAVEGFRATNNNDGNGVCFEARPLATGKAIAYVAFINDIAAGCPLAGFHADGYPGAFALAVDELALVGDIAFNAAQSASYCGSGLSINTPVNVDSLPGTHIFVSQTFSYGNVNGPCSVNSLYRGGFTNMAANAAAGSATISVAAVAGWGVNWPIGAANGANYPSASPAIITTGATPTLVTSVNGTTVGLSNKVAAPGLTNGQLLAIGTSSDGEGLIFDSWGINPYTKPAVVENNLFWNNGAHGYEMFCGGSPCAQGLNVLVTQNTMYCNAQDYKRDGNVWEFYDASSGAFPFTVTNNLAQACVAKPFASQTFNNVGLVGTGQPVVAAGFGRTGVTVTGNYFAAVPGVACPVYAQCAGPNNDLADYNGANYAQGNVLGVPPGFAAPNSLPKAAPDCSAYTNVVDCMNKGYKVAASMTSSVAPDKGYQAPAAACQPDPNYPTWLKGVVYLHWTGDTVVQSHGLVTTPCGL
jgi:hypothetical protein